MQEDIKPPKQDVSPLEEVHKAPVAESRREQNADKPAGIAGPETAAQIPGSGLPASEPQTKNQTSERKDVEKQNDEHHLIPIILALVILAFLTVVAIMANMNKSSEDQNTSNTNGASQQTGAGQAAGGSASAQDQQTVSDAIKTIDGLSDEEDTSGQSLSDQSLGL